MEARPSLLIPGTLTLLLASGAAIGAQPEDREAAIRRLIRQAEAAFREDQPEKAVELADRAIALAPRAAPLYQYRGTLRFRLGHIEPSIADFDRAVELEPPFEPYNWQRAISYYYAGRYAEARRQFELHQTVNANDVENAAWHFLCVARLEGTEKARAALLPIRRDDRVPMMRIYALLAGQAQPADVLAAARAGDPPPDRLRQRLFYAHAYLGLYYEAIGDDEQAARHIELAATRHSVDHYMGHVARIHFERLSAAGGGGEESGAPDD